MSRSDPLLKRRELLGTTAGAVGVACLPTAATAGRHGTTTARRATTTQDIQTAPDPEEYGEIVAEMDGDGSTENPYVVTNIVELQAIEGEPESAYTLGGDIDAAVTSEWNDGTGLTPIGTEEKPFMGTFDGDGNEIQNLRINRPESTLTGMFLVSGGTIQNVTLSGVEITGQEITGSIVGQNAGGIRNVSVDGTVSGQKFVGGAVGAQRGQIVSVTTAVEVNGTDSVGGISGNNKGAISKVTATGPVTGSRRVGGIAGQSEEQIRNVAAEGAVSGEVVVGGVIGRNNGTVRASEATGTVEGTEKVGGFVGEHWGDLRESIASGTVTGDISVGGFAGENWGKIGDVAVWGETNGRERVGGLAGWNGTGSVFETSYVTGPVTGETTVGALVGRLGWEFQEAGKKSVLRYSYWDSETINRDGVGESDSGDGETVVETARGLLSDQLRGEAVSNHMIAFDFDDIWRPISGEPPRLRVFTQPVFDIVNISTDSIEVGQNDTISVEVTVKNTSEWGGEKRLAFRVNQETIGSQTFALEPGAQRTVGLSIPASDFSPGTYGFTIQTADASKSGTLTVTGPGQNNGSNTPDETDTATTPTATETATTSSDDGGPGFGILSGLASLGGTAYLLSRRLSDRE